MPHTLWVLCELQLFQNQLLSVMPDLFDEPDQIRTVRFPCWGNCNLWKEPGLMFYPSLLWPMLVSLQKVTIPHFLLLFVDQFKGPIRPGAFPTGHSVPVLMGRVCCVIACIHASFLSRLYVPRGQRLLPPWPSWWPHNLFWMVLSERIDFISNLATCPGRGTIKSVPGTFLSQDAASHSDVC